MHKIEVYPNQVVCSCGFHSNTIGGAVSLRLGYNHARANRPSVVVDRRLCSDTCKLSQEKATFFGEHHHDCFNSTQNPFGNLDTTTEFS